MPLFNIMNVPTFLHKAFVGYIKSKSRNNEIFLDNLDNYMSRKSA